MTQTSNNNPPPASPVQRSIISISNVSASIREVRAMINDRRLKEYGPWPEGAAPPDGPAGETPPSVFSQLEDAAEELIYQARLLEDAARAFCEMSL